MSGRTFAIGDIHGETGHLFKLLSCLPKLEADDTVVFLGDYLDRGPKSKDVIDYVRTLPTRTPAKVVCLRGNHEDAWLRVCKRGWDEFVLPPGNGCLAALRSYTGGSVPEQGENARDDEMMELTTGTFFPDEVVRWLDELPYWYEDEHAIYVHAGLPPNKAGGFLHPSKVEDPMVLLWIRTEAFFREYRGKRVVFGHTRTEFLPQELSNYTPDDPTDLWAGENVIGIDTGCGSGGFLTAVELPTLNVYESR
jgi:serine/threonine protein phosphatase 1